VEAAFSFSNPAPGARSPASAQARSRAAARALRIARSARGPSAGSAATSREITGSEATGPKAGATVKVAACTGAATQTWAIGQVSGNDFGPITNMATGNVLTDPASSTVNGTRLIMEHSRGDLSGPWRVSYHHYVAG